MEFRSRSNPYRTKQPAFTFRGNEMEIQKSLSPRQMHGSQSHLAFTGSSIVGGSGYGGWIPQPYQQFGGTGMMQYPPQPPGMMPMPMGAYPPPQFGTSYLSPLQPLSIPPMQPQYPPQQFTGGFAASPQHIPYTNNFNRYMGVSQSVPQLSPMSMSPSPVENQMYMNGPVETLAPIEPPVSHMELQGLAKRDPPKKPDNLLEEYPSGGLPVQLLASKSAATNQPIRKNAKPINFTRKQYAAKGPEIKVFGPRQEAQPAPRQQRQRKMPASDPDRQSKYRETLFDEEPTEAESKRAGNKVRQPRKPQQLEPIRNRNATLPLRESPQPNEGQQSQKHTFLKRSKKTVPIETHLTQKGRRKVQYQPYTIADYKKLKTEQSKKKYKSLGNGEVGTDRWNSVKTKSDRRKEYSLRIMEANKAKYGRDSHTAIEEEDED